MRLLVITLALLAGLKVWTQDRMVRGIMGDAIVAAYRDAAERSCQRVASGGGKAAAIRFAPDRDVLIGNPHVDVALWDYDSPLWNVRYRHPQVVLTSGDPRAASCTYDVISGLAQVVRAR